MQNEGIMSKLIGHYPDYWTATPADFRSESDFLMWKWLSCDPVLDSGTFSTVGTGSIYHVTRSDPVRALHGTAIDIFAAWTTMQLFVSHTHPHNKSLVLLYISLITPKLQSLISNHCYHPPLTLHICRSSHPVYPAQSVWVRRLCWLFSAPWHLFFAPPPECISPPLPWFDQRFSAPRWHAATAY